MHNLHIVNHECKSSTLEGYSLADLAKKHVSKTAIGSQCSPVNSDSGLASQTTEIRFLQPSLSSIAAQYSSKSGRQQLASPHHLSTKRVESSQPTLSGLSTKHSAKETPVSTSSLSNLAGQQPTIGGFLQPSLSTLAAKRSTNEIAPNSLSGLARGHTSKDSGTLKFMTPAQITPTKVQPSLSSLAAEYSASKCTGVQPSLSSSAHIIHRPPIGSGDKKESTLSSLAAKHFATSKQPDSVYHRPAVAVPSSSSLSTLNSVCESEISKRKLYDGKRHHLCGIRTDDILTSLVQEESHLQQKLSLSREQESLLLVSDKIKHMEESKKALHPPPGFKDIDNTSYFKQTTEHPSLFPSFSYLSTTQLNSSKPLSPAQPSLFSMVMCRRYSLHHALVQIQHTREAHHKIMKTMLLELESVTKFNFSDSSPDDIVRDKQTEGFNRK